MKKAVVFALTGIMAVSMFGCGSKKQVEVSSVDDLKDLTIGVQTGTTGDSYASDAVASDSQMKRYNKGADAIQALKTGKIDAVVIDSLPAQKFVDANDDLKIVENIWEPEEYAICLKKGNTELTEKMNAAIKVQADSITTEVKKKVNSSEFGTKITQNAYNVRVAWNGNSKYIQLEAGQLAIYNGEVSTSQKRAVFDEQGNHFYRDGYYVGKIGTNQWSGNNAHKGLVFDLDYQGKYMAFAQMKSQGAGSYTTMLCFSRAGSIYDQYGIHLGCDFYGHWFDMYNVDLHDVNINGYGVADGKSIPIVTEIHDNGNGTVGWTTSSISVRGGMITAVPQGSANI